MHLGNLGGEETQEAVEVTFDYFGKTIAVNPNLGELDYVDFLDGYGGIDVNDPAAIRIVKSFARICIAETDFETFWATAKQHRQGVEGVFGVCEKIVEAVSDRPTERPSSSSDTPSTTGTSSALPASVAARLEGRPDLQLLTQQAAQGVKAG